MDKQVYQLMPQPTNPEQSPKGEASRNPVPARALSETARRELSEAAARLLSSGMPSGPVDGLRSAFEISRAAAGMEAAVNRHGTTVSQRPDGASVTERLDGSRITARLDGSVLREYADGLQIAERADGSSIHTLKGRLLEVRYPDGSVRRFGYNGDAGRLNQTTLVTPDCQGASTWRLSTESSLSLQMQSPNRETLLGLAAFSLNQRSLLTLPALIGTTEAWRSDTGVRSLTDDKTDSNGDYSYIVRRTGDKVLHKADGTRIDFLAGDRPSEIRYADGRSASVRWNPEGPSSIRLPNGETLELKKGKWAFKQAASDPAVMPAVSDVRVHKNGDLSYKTDLGITHIYRVNGDHERVFGDNTRDVERPDGSRLITLDSDGKCKLFRHSNGDSARYNSAGELSELDTKDGVWRRIAGGKWSYAKAVGQPQQEFAGRVMSDGNGNCCVVNAKGERTIYRNDGSRTREFAAGEITRQTTLKDGTIISQNKDGSTERVSPDKTIAKSDRLGRVVSVADGKGGNWKFEYAGITESIVSISHGDRTWKRDGSSDKWRNEKGEVRETQDVVPFKMIATAFITDSKRLSALLHDTNVLERRLQTVPGMKPAEARSELRKVKGDICRLLIAGDNDTNEDVDGKQVNPRIKQKERVLLAQELAHLSAFPTHTDQGFHGTCSITTVQTRLLHRSPSIVSKMIGDLALTSSYETAAGTKIKYDSKDPSLTFDGDRRQRLFVSQLFQVTATNAFWMNQEKDPDGNAVKKGTIRYQQRYQDRERSDGGERLINAATGKEVRDWSAINITRVREMSRNLTGRDENFAVAHVTRGKFDSVRSYETKEQLRQILKDMKRDNLLPASFSVSTGDKLFGGYTDATMHAVSVIDYDEKTGLVSLDNQWGNANDYIGEPDTNPKITFDRFYESTIDRSEEKKEKTEKQG